jgi:hypothetical protein
VWLSSSHGSIDQHAALGSNEGYERGLTHTVSHKPAPGISLHTSASLAYLRMITVCNRTGFVQRCSILPRSKAALHRLSSRPRLLNLAKSSTLQALGVPIVAVCASTSCCTHLWTCVPISSTLSPLGLSCYRCGLSCCTSSGC